MTLVFGSILGFISVAFGAYAEHGLKIKISEEDFRQVMVALRYNQIHAIIITSIGLFLISNNNHSLKRNLTTSGWLFILGTILFSFSIYLAKSCNLPFLINLAPIGGITLMIAWLSLTYIGIINTKIKTT